MRLPALATALAFLIFPPLLFAQPVDPLGIGEDTEEVSGYRVVLKSGNELLGLAKDPEGADTFLVLKTAKGPVKVPRSEIARVEPVRIPAAEVFTPTERYEMRAAQILPQSAEDHVLFAQWCMQIGAYEQAAEHAGHATELLEGKDDVLAKLLLKRANHMKLAFGAVEAKGVIRRLVAEKKYSQALAKLAEIRAEFADRPDILTFLRLDDLEREIRGKAISPKYAALRTRWRKALDRCVKDRLLDPGLTVEEALKWASAPDGLAEAFFEEIARDLGVTVKQAREMWALRSLDGTCRFAYGSASFLRPELAGNLDPAAPGAWWAEADARAKAALLRAWFAERSGLLDVVRLENRTCRRCGGKGVLVTMSTTTAERVRTECRGCMRAGQDWIVICR